MNPLLFPKTVFQKGSRLRELGRALCLLVSLPFLATGIGRPNPIPHSTVVCIQRQGIVSQFQADPGTVETIFRQGLLRLCQAQTVEEAWRKKLGVQPTDVVGIKISSSAGPLMATRFALVRAVVKSLRESGLPPSHIIVWDKYEDDLVRSGYLPPPQELPCQVLSVIPATGFDPRSFYVNELWGKLIWGDLLFRGVRPTPTELYQRMHEGPETTKGGDPEDPNTSNRSFYARLVTQICTKLVHVPALVDHPSVGFSGCLADLALGMVDNSRRFLSEGVWGDPAIPEILSQADAGKRTVLHVLDALLVQYAGGPRCAPEYTYPLGALYFSQDPVAIDSLVRPKLEAWRKGAKVAPLGPRTRYIETAARLGLGVADPKKIEFIVLP
jgi:hypothetical protein